MQYAVIQICRRVQKVVVYDNDGSVLGTPVVSESKRLKQCAFVGKDHLVVTHDDYVFFVSRTNGWRSYHQSRRFSYTSLCELDSTTVALGHEGITADGTSPGVHFRNVSTGSKLDSIRDQRKIISMCVVGRVLVTGTQDPSVRINKKESDGVWSTGFIRLDEVVHTQNVSSHRWVRSVCNIDDVHVACAISKYIRIVNVLNRRILKTLEDSWPTALCKLDVNRIASTGLDSQVKVWHVWTS